MLKKALFIGAFVLVFIAGGLVVYVAQSPYYEVVRKKITSSEKKAASAKNAQGGAKKEEKKSEPEEAVPSVALFSAHAQAPEALVPNSRELSQIIDVLRTDYVDAPSLVSHDLNAASLGKALAAAGTKVRISAAPLTSTSDFLPPKSSKLPYDITYWRVSSFGDKAITKLLKTWNDNQLPKGLIIDLRDFQAVNDYHGMADFAGLFIPAKTPLFSMQGTKIARKDYLSERQPLVFSKKMPLVVLINGNTRGAGELLAYLLDKYSKAILLGQSTPGEVAMYSEVRMSSGRFLRVAIANVLLPDGKNLAGVPLEPEVYVSVKPEEESSLLLLEYKNDLADYIKELPTRRKLNEAGLVHDENAELDEMVEEQMNPGKGDSGSGSRDLPLRNAVDVVRSIGISFEPPTVYVPTENK